MIPVLEDSVLSTIKMLCEKGEGVGTYLQRRMLHRIESSDAAQDKLVECLEKAHYELSALTPEPAHAGTDNSQEMWPGASNPADRECLRSAMAAIQDALAHASATTY